MSREALRAGCADSDLTRKSVPQPGQGTGPGVRPGHCLCQLGAHSGGWKFFLLPHCPVVLEGSATDGIAWQPEVSTKAPVTSSTFPGLAARSQQTTNSFETEDDPGSFEDLNPPWRPGRYLKHHVTIALF